MGLATGNIRANTGTAQERRDRARQAAEDMIAALDQIEANLGETTESAEGLSDLRDAVKQAMLAAGVRETGGIRT